MISLLQRVREARVEIEAMEVAAIGRGILAMVAFEQGDTEPLVDRMLDRILDYRIFSDSDGRMNQSVRDIEGGLLLVPQFTLAADTSSGLRPSFSPAAKPEVGRTLFDYFVIRAREVHQGVAAGQFGFDMLVHLVNEGPATFWIRLPPVSLATK